MQTLVSARLAVVCTEHTKINAHVKGLFRCSNPEKSPFSESPRPQEVIHCTVALAGKATLTNGLLLGRSEVLRSLRHYLRAQSRRHHTIDRLEEREARKEESLDDLP